MVDASRKLASNNAKPHGDPSAWKLEATGLGAQDLGKLG